MILSSSKTLSSGLKRQSAIANANLFWFVPVTISFLHYITRYKIRSHRKIRSDFLKEFQQNSERPMIFVANHLTLIDSFLIIWAIFDWKSPRKTLKGFCWNVPEISNFGQNFLLRFFCYLGKCVYVARQGSLSTKRETLKKLAFLLSEKQSICIFPEGGRSRSGRIDLDSTNYGVGELYRQNPDALIYCLYVRGDKQKTYSNFPAKGDNFTFLWEKVSVNSQERGKRFDRDISLQLMQKLIEMESRYFTDRK